jgi:signal transduction histidine kinase
VRLRSGEADVPVYDIRKFNNGRSGILDTPALARSMAQTLGKNNAVLLLGHGAVVVSNSVYGVVSGASGLASAARWLVDGIAQRSGIQVTLDAPRDMARLPAEVEIGLFRVLQEGLTNVHRHSGASAANVLIRQEARQIILEIKDNGRGIRQEALSRFDLTGAGMGVGLSGMRERVRELGGRMKVKADSQGTSLLIVIPLPLECAPTTLSS